jgi:hypothetical protein
MPVNLSALRDKTLTQGLASNSIYVVPKTIAAPQSAPVQADSPMGWPALTPSDGVADAATQAATAAAGAGGSGSSISGGGTPSALPASTAETTTPAAATATAKTSSAPVVNGPATQSSITGNQQKAAAAAPKPSAQVNALISMSVQNKLNTNDVLSDWLNRTKKPAAKTAATAKRTPTGAIVESKDWFTATQQR